MSAREKGAGAGDGVTWRALGSGCSFGRAVLYRVERLERSDEVMIRKVDRMTWALVTMAITFGTMTIGLVLNLVVH